jgi:hypothetical protein
LASEQSVLGAVRIRPKRSPQVRCRVRCPGRHTSFARPCVCLSSQIQISNSSAIGMYLHSLVTLSSMFPEALVQVHLSDTGRGKDEGASPEDIQKLTKRYHTPHTHTHKHTLTHKLSHTHSHSHNSHTHTRKAHHTKRASCRELIHSGRGDAQCNTAVLPRSHFAHIRSRRRGRAPLPSSRECPVCFFASCLHFSHRPKTECLRCIRISDSLP